jgi:arsenate reductase
MKDKKKILFLCDSNSCRSQMAEGVLRHYHKDRYDVYSAGVKLSSVHPVAIKVTEEIGIDISKQRSKLIEEFLGLDFDCVITLCGDNARDLCPVFPGKTKRRLHWNFPDPAQAKGRAEEVLEVFRKVRDEIRAKIEEFVKQSRKENKG